MDLTKLLLNVSRVLKINNIFSLENSNNEDIHLKTKDGQVFDRFIPAALHIGQLSSQKGFIGSTKEEQGCVYQWLEYCLLRNQSQIMDILEEMNTSYMIKKVYLAGNEFTLADLIMYLYLYETYSKFTFQDKETYSNVSRWFRQVQNVACAQDLYPKICFSKTRLYT
ncbi:eukaryotic translation elongation factor 1 epsilon-1 [Trichonephila inaurata madagascariensis]|uniref:Eukaryotic translation elongation factor 1 epsilon-1 n=1 Tax=Trichonephila inaurata madagascariensis TaxID=2747483 RepID=A0A8X7BVL3_9ARAC|nr:eukaryotic translation elongation factor 1 epsilon-1 [Trichonephila inaurata madagascariensis]